MKKIVMAVGVLLLCGGCSTVLNGTTQDVVVQTNTMDSASCELRDKKNEYSVTAPGTVTVNRGDGPLVIQCQNATGAGQIVATEIYDPTSIWLGHGGLLIDAISGAYQSYPPQIVVQMAAH